MRLAASSIIIALIALTIALIILIVAYRAVAKRAGNRDEKHTKMRASKFGSATSATSATSASRAGGTGGCLGCPDGYVTSSFALRSSNQMRCCPEGTRLRCDCAEVVGPIESYHPNTVGCLPVCRCV